MNKSKVSEFGKFVYRVTEKIISREKSRNNILSVIIYGSLVDEGYVEGLSDINVCIVTENLVRDLYSLKSILVYRFWNQYKRKLSPEVFPYIVFREFYIRGIPLPVIVVKSGFPIKTDSAIIDLKRREYRCGDLSLYYSLCRAVRELSFSISFFLKRDIAGGIRFLQHSLVHALRSIIIAQEKRVPCTINDILNQLKKMNKDELSNLLSLVTTMKKNAFRLEKSLKRKHLSLRANNSIIVALKKTYNVISLAWRLVGINLVSYEELTNILDKIQATEIVMRCHNNNPILEAYDKNWQYHRIPLFTH
ncbi:MAG: hypothetical protein ACTSX9_08930 [Candidatus Njordarchaeales archaeon]